MVRVLSQMKKEEHTKSAFFFFGTPERTLTSDLSLRRRLLYTTELLRHINALIHNEVILSNFRDAVKTVGAN